MAGKRIYNGYDLCRRSAISSLNLTQDFSFRNLALPFRKTTFLLIGTSNKSRLLHHPGLGEGAPTSRVLRFENSPRLSYLIDEFGSTGTRRQLEADNCSGIEPALKCGAAPN